MAVSFRIAAVTPPVLDGKTLKKDKVMGGEQKEEEAGLPWCTSEPEKRAVMEVVLVNPAAQIDSIRMAIRGAAFIEILGSGQPYSEDSMRAYSMNKNKNNIKETASSSSGKGSPKKKIAAAPAVDADLLEVLVPITQVRTLQEVRRLETMAKDGVESTGNQSSQQVAVWDFSRKIRNVLPPSKLPVLVPQKSATAGYSSAESESEGRRVWRWLRFVLTMPYGTESDRAVMGLDAIEINVPAADSVLRGSGAGVQHQLEQLRQPQLQQQQQQQQGRSFVGGLASPVRGGPRSAASPRPKSGTSPRSKKLPPPLPGQLGIDAFLKKPPGLAGAPSSSSSSSSSSSGWAALAQQRERQQAAAAEEALRGCTLAFSSGPDLSVALRERLMDMVQHLGGSIVGDGKLTSVLVPETTHFVCGNASAPEFPLADNSEHIFPVTDQWVSMCMREQQRLDERPYLVPGSQMSSRQAAGAVARLKRTLSGTDGPANELAAEQQVRLPAAKRSRYEVREGMAEDDDVDTDSMDEAEIASARRRVFGVVPAATANGSLSSGAPSQTVSPNPQMISSDGSDTEPLADDGDVPAKSQEKSSSKAQHDIPAGLNDERESESEDLDEFLDGVVLFFSPDLSDKRMRQLKGLAVAFGARVSAYNQPDVTHIITGRSSWCNDFSGAASDNPRALFVQDKWLVQCQKKQRRVPVEPYLVTQDRE